MRLILQGFVACGTTWQERLAGRFREWSFRMYLSLRKSSGHPADRSVFRQKHRGFKLALAYKIGAPGEAWERTDN
jgi:hypothetical protein